MKGFHGKHTQETKDKIRLKLRGRVLSAEVKNKISVALKGKQPKYIPNNKGRMPSLLAFTNSINTRKKGLSEKAKLNMSIAHKKSWASGGRIVTPEARKKMIEANRGEKNHSWKGGITPFYLALRGQSIYREWRNLIFKRDNYTCTFCQYKSKGTRPADINADHIKPFSVIIRENNIQSLEQAMECIDLWLIENGRTLCIPCHKKTPTYGGKINGSL